MRCNTRSFVFVDSTRAFDTPRYLLVGPDRAGNVLELVIVDVGGEELVIHAMPLRHSTAEELFGDER